MFRIKNTWILLTISVLTLTLSSETATADVPNYVNYQGRLTDDGGEPITGSKSIKFKIYASPSGDDSLWSSNFQTVQIDNGLFEYKLGYNVSLPEGLFAGDSPRYLGITVDTDLEITPRTQFITVPYAVHAMKADTSTYALGGPGAATLVSPDMVQLGTTYGPVDSISIDTPSDGIVIVTATGSLRLEPNTTSEYLICSLGQSSTNENTNCTYYYRNPDALPGHPYYQPLSLTYVDSVTGGTQKYYLGGVSDATFGAFVRKLAMTAVYYPTAYGNVEETE
jgi:hypothetical protein